MINIRPGAMEYDKIDEIANYSMFITACLTEEQLKELKEEWEKQGGYKVKHWWKFVMENTKLSVDIRK